MEGKIVSYKAMVKDILHEYFDVSADVGEVAARLEEASVADWLASQVTSCKKNASSVFR